MLSQGGRGTETTVLLEDTLLGAGGRGTETTVLLEDTLLGAGGRGTETTVLLDLHSRACYYVPTLVEQGLRALFSSKQKYGLK